MKWLISILSLAFKSVHLYEDDICYVNGIVNIDMELLGWILIELNDQVCIIIYVNDHGEVKKGYLMNKEKVIEMIGGKEFLGTINNTIDKEDGVRFEGSTFGIPFGFGSLFDENGNRIYEGMMINWDRMGYGVSFNENGFKEYEGYWCNDMQCGNGKLFDIEGNIIYEGSWMNGCRVEDYVGNGEDLSTAVKRLKFNEKCIMKMFDVSLFIYLEELTIGNHYFCSLDTFLIDGLNHLKSLRIGYKSFTNSKKNVENDPSRSFHVVNCLRLEIIDISRWSFSDYGGGFELKNLPCLSSIKIGDTGKVSYNFYYSSFIVQNLPNLETIEIGKYSFCFSLTTVILNLPKLKSIRLGSETLAGRNNGSCILLMKDLPQLENLISNGFSYILPPSVVLSNIPNLKMVQLPVSFRYVQVKSIENVSPLLADLVQINSEIGKKKDKHCIAF